MGGHVECTVFGETLTAVLVPSNFVNFRDTTAFVKVFAAGTVSERIVSLGEVNSGVVEIKAGLAQDEVVVAQYAQATNERESIEASQLVRTVELQAPVEALTPHPSAPPENEKLQKMFEAILAEETKQKPPRFARRGMPQGEAESTPPIH
jgi:hypothetical protein